MYNQSHYWRNLIIFLTVVAFLVVFWALGSGKLKASADTAEGLQGGGKSFPETVVDGAQVFANWLRSEDSPSIVEGALK